MSIIEPTELQVVDLGPGIGSYISETPGARYPVYTRGNAGEVWPEVVYPLSASLSRREGVEPVLEPIFASGLVSERDITDGYATFGGIYGGYQYLNLSFNRMMAIRMPGVSVEQSDATYLGSEGVAPPHRPRPDDKSLLATLRSLRYGWKTINTTELPRLADDRRLVDGWRARLPELLAAPDERIVAVIRELQRPIMILFAHHLEITGQAGGSVQILAGICEDRLGDRSLSLAMLGGLGDVDSAAPSFEMWRLGRLVASDAALTAHFDAGVAGLDERLRADPPAAAFVGEFDVFLERFGSRGPNEWETATPTWGTHPELPLALIDRMRPAGDEHDPSRRAAELAKERERAIADARDGVGRLRRGTFDKAIRSATLFSQSRERTKTTVVDLIHVSRLLQRELAARIAARVEGGTTEDLWFVFDAELDAYIGDPTAFTDAIAERRAARAELVRREPPFVFDGELPPPHTWPLRDDADTSTSLAVGASLTGLAGCAGVAEGRARVVTDPADPGDLGPGDVLVAPLTDPAWTPLFVPVEAVVVDVGGQMSHAVIVSRELGRPCVVAATDATTRIPDGARIRVDGTNGTVTVLP